MKYAAIVDDYYMSEGYDKGDPPYRVAYKSIQEFKDEAELLTWVTTQAKSSFNKKYQIIKYEEVEIETKISIKSKPIVRDNYEPDRFKEFSGNCTG